MNVDLLIEPLQVLLRQTGEFLPRLAGASPLFIYRPAQYLKKFNPKYNKKVAEAEKSGTSKRSWAAVHNREDNMYQFDNPQLPTLQPWMNTSKPPADRFVALRNPYFHRVDASGRQLPYIDRVVLAVAERALATTSRTARSEDP